MHFTNEFLLKAREFRRIAPFLSVSIGFLERSRYRAPQSSRAKLRSFPVRPAMALAQSHLFTEGHHSSAVDSSAAFAEFRELVAGAAAQIVGEVLQRRPKPDPATLVGEGKVIEIAAVSESAILKREFSGDFVYVAVSGPASLLRRYRQYRRTRK